MKKRKSDLESAMVRAGFDAGIKGMPCVAPPAGVKEPWEAGWRAGRSYFDTKNACAKYTDSIPLRQAES